MRPFKWLDDLYEWVLDARDRWDARVRAWVLAPLILLLMALLFLLVDRFG